MEEVQDFDSGHSEGCKEPIKKQRNKKNEKTLTERFVKSYSKFQSTDVAFRGSDCEANGTDDVIHETNCEGTESDLEYNALVWKLVLLVQEFKTLSSSDFVSKFDRAAKKVGIRLKFTEHDSKTVNNGLTYFESKLSMDSVELAVGQGLNKVSSKYDTYTKAIEKIFSSSMHFHLESRGVDIDISREAFCNSTEKADTVFANSSSLDVEHKQTCMAAPKEKKKKQKKSSNSVSEFVIIQRVQQGMKSVSVLRQSSKVNQTKLQFLYKQVDSGYVCRVFLNEDLLGECKGTTKKDSKERVSTIALKKLRLHCWTILRKFSDVKDETNIKIEDLIENVDKPISTDNIGNILLQKMGWTGGGIGKCGNKGSIEPISVNINGNSRGHGNRKGFGSQSFGGLNIDFTSKVQNILKDYALSSDPDSLTFLCPFFPKEKAIIKSESQKLGLKTKTEESTVTERVIVSHNWDAQQLLSQLRVFGDSSREYTLFPPKSLELLSNHVKGTALILDIIPPLVDEDLTLSPDDYSVNVNDDFYSATVDENTTSVKKDEALSSAIANEYATFVKKDEDLSSAQANKYAAFVKKDEELSSEQASEYATFVKKDEDLLSAIANEYVPSVKKDEELSSAIANEYALSVKKDEDISSAKAKEYVRSVKKDEDISSAKAKEYVRSVKKDEDLFAAKANKYAPSVKKDEELSSAQASKYTPSVKKDEELSSAQASEYATVVKKDEDFSYAKSNKYDRSVKKAEDIFFMINRDSLKLISKEDMKMDFHQKVKTFLMNFSGLANPDNLIFSTEFTKEQRALISVEAQNIGLITCDILFLGKAVLIVNKPTAPPMPINDKELCDKTVVSGHKLQTVRSTDKGKDRQSNQIIGGRVSKTLMTPKDSGIILKSDVKSSFVEEVRKILMDFSQNPNPNVLLLSSHFSEQKCWIIHKECSQLGLIRKFEGYGRGTYVVIGHKNTLKLPTRDQSLGTVDYLSTSCQRVNKFDSDELTLEILPKPVSVDNKISQEITWSDKPPDNTAQGDSCFEDEPTFACSFINMDDTHLTKKTDLGLISNPDFKLDLRQKVKTVLVEYLKSGSENGLIFADNFANKERKIICQESKKLGFQTHDMKHKVIVTNPKPNMFKELSENKIATGENVFQEYYHDNKITISSKSINRMSEDLVKQQDPGCKEPFCKEIDFVEKATQILIDYAEFPTLDQLLFSSEFSMDERVIIHQISRELGLRTRDIGSGPARQLTVHHTRALTRRLRRQRFANGIRGANSQQTNDLHSQETTNYILVNRQQSGEPILESTDNRNTSTAQ